MEPVITKQEKANCGKCLHHCNNALVTLELLEGLQEVYEGIGELVTQFRERWKYMTQGSNFILNADNPSG